MQIQDDQNGQLLDEEDSVFDNPQFPDITVKLSAARSKLENLRSRTAPVGTLDVGFAYRFTFNVSRYSEKW